ncbi:MAG: hypothetical protein ABI193_00860 [Minicystis sp.]
MAAARWAPTVDNCQPWSFHWDGAALHIDHDTDRAAGVLNREGRLSCLSLGCVLEAVALAAGTEGLAAEARTSLDEPSTWATVRFAPTSVPADDLAATMASRCTDRRLYRGGSPLDPVFDRLRGEALRFPDCGLYVVGPCPEELLRYIDETESYVWTHDDTYRDVMRWFRFSRAELEATGDGLPWNALGFDLPELGLFRLARSPLLPRLARGRGLSLVARAWLRLLITSSAALVCITVRSPQKEALSSAGRLAYRAWLHLNRRGFGVQPVTQHALLAYYHAIGALPSTVRPEFVERFRRGRGVFSRGFGYPPDELPVWVLRAGLSPSLSAHQRSLRRPLDRIFTSV